MLGYDDTVSFTMFGYMGCCMLFNLGSIGTEDFLSGPWYSGIQLACCFVHVERNVQRDRRGMWGLEVCGRGLHILGHLKETL